MQRRFNYTNRQRIYRKDVSFTIVEDNEGKPKFYADLNLNEYDLPPNAKVSIEAYDRNALMRFPFGSVEEPKSSAPTTLSDFVGSDSYYFRVKVVDQQNRSRLFAVADSISPVRRDDEGEPAKSLLRVATRDLGSTPWKLEYPVADHPLLLINNQIDMGKALARSNLFFQASVLPAILEQILRRILLEEDYHPTASPEDDDMWKEGWLEFAGRLPGNTTLPIDQKISEDDCKRWIEDARDGFCITINAIHKIRSALKETDI